MLSNYQLKIADLYNIPIGNVKKLMTNFFGKRKIRYVINYEILQLYLRLGLKLKKLHCVRIQSISKANIMLNSTHKK